MMAAAASNWRWIPGAASLSLAIVGCGSTAATPAPSPSGAASARVTLQHVPHGEAILSLSGGSLTATISLTGLAPDSLHPAHIHSGSCAHQGAMLYPLSPVSANSTGMAADRTSTVPRVKEGRIPASGWYVNVHNGPELGPPEQSESIACGDVANPQGSASVTVALESGAPGDAGQAASGEAELTIHDGALRVVLTAHGLAPGSSHAAHLHAGSCEVQGRVVHPLRTLTADVQGNAGETTTIPGVASIPPGAWYINVHRSTRLEDQTGFDPIICGNVPGG